MNTKTRKVLVFSTILAAAVIGAILLNISPDNSKPYMKITINYSDDREPSTTTFTEQGTIGGVNYGGKIAGIVFTYAPSKTPFNVTYHWEGYKEYNVQSAPLYIIQETREFDGNNYETKVIFNAQEIERRIANMEECKSVEITAFYTNDIFATYKFYTQLPAT